MTAAAQSNRTEEACRIHVAALGWEEALLDELQRVFPASQHEITSPGWIQSRLAASERGKVAAVAFARQVLPLAAPIDAPSIRAWSQASAGHLIESLREVHAPWRLHVFGVATPGGTAGPRRARLIEEAIGDHLKRKQKRLLPLLVRDHAQPFQKDEWLVQVGLVSAARGFLSICPPAERAIHRRVISGFPGGVLSIPDDPAAPSGAYRKLVEAQLRLGRTILPGETCVDLGASPGGWTHVAVLRGAYVLAVDRAPLEPRLARNPLVRFHRGDAFRFAPDERVDWLLSDVIAFPQRIAELLERWVTGRWCRRFVVTVKFRGTGDYPLLDSIKRMLDAEAVEYQMRRLDSNRNEVTVSGELAPSD